MDAMITARCEMLLSPGTVISASIRAARFTRKSSMILIQPAVGNLIALVADIYRTWRE
jgi:hypothetical protein